MKVSPDRLKYSKKIGDATEKRYANLMIQKGKTVIKATKEQDMYDHIDYWVNGISVDVKGSRHLECIWLELTNINGNRGWLKGKAEYIMFDVIELSSFRAFKRLDLLRFIETNAIEHTDDKREYMKIYTRKKWNKLDEVVKVRYDHIKHLEKGFAQYEGD